MHNSGFVVRFVDVVLILLFCFIIISSVRATEIDLAESTEIPAPALETQDVVFVGIRPDGTYLVDEERLALRGPRQLFDFLASESERLADRPVTVRIRASHDTPMRYLVDAARVTDQLGLPKALEVRMAGGG